MKNAFYFLLFLFPSAMFSQSKFEFGLSLSPSIGLPLYVSDGTAPNGVIEAIKDVETWAPGGSAMIQVKMNFSERISAMTGFGYTVTGYGTKESELNFPMPDPTQPEKVKLIYRKTYLEVPVQFRWRIGKSEAPDFFYLSGGAALWLNLTNKTIQRATFAGGKVERSSTEDTQLDYRKSNILVQLGVGYEQQVSEQMRLAIEPQVKMTLLTLIDEDVPLNRKLLTAGLAFSVYFK